MPDGTRTTLAAAQGHAYRFAFPKRSVLLNMSATLQDRAFIGSEVTGHLLSKGISYGTLTAHPDGSVDTSNVDGVNTDLRVRPFFHE